MIKTRDCSIYSPHLNGHWWLTFCPVSCLSPSDGAPSKRKQLGDNQVPPSGEQRPPSPPGPPPSALLGNVQQARSETQPGQDISPAVAAALLQLISHQDSESGAPQRSKDPSPAVDAPAPGQPPPPWVADSPPKPSAEAPAGLVTSAPTTAAQFPKDQDLRFSHGAARWPSLPWWDRPMYHGTAPAPGPEGKGRRGMQRGTPILWLTGPWVGS